MDKYFIITVDTEGDNCWSIKDIKQPVTTENARYLLRFQILCEKYEFIPTYLTNYEMSQAEAMIELGRNGVQKGTLEIGAHLHAWNQPPFFPLIKSPFERGKAYLGEYPSKVIFSKLEYLTKNLENIFGCDIRSFRSGRWYMDGAIVRCLEKLGYLVDCSCTPYVSWKENPGWSLGSHGTDWSTWENKIQRFCLVDKMRKRESEILEVPVSIIKQQDGNCIWLRPNGNNLANMIRVIDEAILTKKGYVEFMIHSSELMVRGSNSFVTRKQIEDLYQDIDELFSYAKSKGFIGIGLSGFASLYMKK